jgi:hypothetical protein
MGFVIGLVIGLAAITPRRRKTIRGAASSRPDT